MNFKLFSIYHQPYGKHDKDASILFKYLLTDGGYRGLDVAVFLCNNSACFIKFPGRKNFTKAQHRKKKYNP